MGITLEEHGEHGAGINVNGETVAVLSFCEKSKWHDLRAEIIKRCNFHERLVDFVKYAKKAARVTNISMKAKALLKELDAGKPKERNTNGTQQGRE